MEKFFDTMNVIFKHEHILSELTSSYELDHADIETCKSFKDGKFFQENTSFQSNQISLQIYLYHDDFSITNPLGNKKKNTRCQHFILS